MSKSHKMISYIHEGPQALHRTLESGEESVLALAERVRRSGIQRIVMTGIGSSYTAALMALPLFHYHCRLPTYVLPGPEGGYYASRLVDQHTLVIAISRSGERGVVVNTIADAVQRGALGVAVTGVRDSLLAQKADLVLATTEGPESVWPKTKSVVTATGLLMRLGLALSEPDDQEAVARAAILRSMPEGMGSVLKAAEPAVRSLVSFADSRDLVALVGTGANYGVAMEGAMKLMEAALVSTRFDTTDGMLCGPIGGVGARWLVLPLVTEADHELTRELLHVSSELGSATLAITALDVDLSGIADRVLRLPVPADPLLGALLYLLPLQLLVYYWAVARGLDPDAPTSVPAILAALLPPGRQEPK